jgi:threonine/homoserine/homoserine lactone efflux protein
VGPVGLLCIGTAIGLGRLRGVAIGLGAATADAVYAAIAGLGLATVSEWVGGQSAALRLAGAAILAIAAFSFLRARTGPAPTVMPRSAASLAGGAAAAFLLTLTNPAPVLVLGSLLSAFGMAHLETAGVVSLVGGVFVGSTTWWIVLSLGAFALRSRLHPGWIRNATVGFGVVLASIAVYLLGSVIVPALI